MTAKRKTSSRVTITMLLIVLTETIRHWTTFFNPFALLMALRGLRALKVRRLLKAVRLELPSTARLRTETCTVACG